MLHRTKYVVGGDGNSTSGSHAGWPHVSVLRGKSEISILVFQYMTGYGSRNSKDDAM